MVNFLIVVFAASTGRLLWVTIVTVSFVEGVPFGFQFVPVAQSVFVVPVQEKVPAKEVEVIIKRRISVNMVMLCVFI